MNNISKTHRLLFLMLVLITIYTSNLNAQTVVVSDDGKYKADESAMLDVYSVDKGMLIPRMTTSQRTHIVNPANGLLVYDQTESCFYYMQNSEWIRLSSINEGAGTDEPLFYVANSAGDTIFAVYNDGVKVTLPPSAKGHVGGFAISGRTASKTGEYEIMKVTQDSTRIYVKDTTYAKGNVGGFAISGRSATKTGTLKSIFYANPDSTRIYIDKTAKKGTVGGFAISGRSATKTDEESYLNITADQTRIYTKDPVGGFGIGDLNTGTAVRYLNLTPQNYFIGHETGLSIDFTGGGYNGKYNTFFGYQCGYSNATGYMNLFSGYEAGYSNTTGLKNVYLGYLAGNSNTNGNLNVMIGAQAGQFSDSSAHDNVHIGFAAGLNKRSGSGNIMIGKFAGGNSEYGQYNVIIGNYAGVNNNGVSTGTRDLSDNLILGRRAGYNGFGSDNVLLGAYAGNSMLPDTSNRNVFIGYYAGDSETGSNKLYIENGLHLNPLIYGEFDNQILGINTQTPSANLHIKQEGSGEEGLAIENDGNTNTWSFEIGTNDLALYYNGTYKGAWDDVTGNYTASSDRRLKKDIKPMEEPILAKVLQLKPVHYNFLNADENAQQTMGFIAQDIQNYFPELVYKEESGFLSLHYPDFGILSIKAIQEQQKIIEKQQQEIDFLKEEIQALKKLITSE